MSISRIDNFNINGRSFFSAIYGPGVVDLFVDNDLKVGGLRETLYRTFRSQGYHVVFYSQNTDLNFFSFRKEDLVDFFGLQPSGNAAAAPQADPGQGRRYVAPIDSPFGSRRRSRGRAGGQAGGNTQRGGADTESADYPQIQTCLSGVATYYRIAASVDPFGQINTYIRNNPSRKMVFVFPTAQTDYYDNVEQVMPFFDDWKATFNSRGYAARMVLIYNTRSEATLFDSADGQLFLRPFFKETLAGLDSSGRIIAGSSPQFYCLNGPKRDEFHNFLNRKRIVDSMTDVISAYGGVNRLAARLAQITAPIKSDDNPEAANVETMLHYLKMDNAALGQLFERQVTENAMSQLRAMAGIDHVMEQLLRYIEALRDSRTNPDAVRFRPHLVFSGNPGTGKTTVARLLARHLQEEGLLGRGQLIEATVGDLVGQYVGETRIKTQALCDRARGGVLFIDEAYGLMSGSSEGGDHVDYGKEAIEVLIQFMENSSDSLVILAGYKADMEHLIAHGNQGFQRRFNGAESFIDFIDYDPDALKSIFNRQIRELATTPEFDDAIGRIITTMYTRRNASWGNASEMEKLASAIKRQRSSRGSKAPLDPADIPDSMMLLIKDDIDVDELLEEINAMVGLPQVKSKLEELLYSTLGGRRLSGQLGVNIHTDHQLNFVFMGNPGTGKTTVAGLMARILYNVGLINRNETVTVKLDNLVKPTIGSSAAAVRKIFEDNSGKVILIDEAHNLSQSGTEAIGALTACLTDQRFLNNQAVILAGYTGPVRDMLARDDGLSSRFMNHWIFEDYTNDDLWQIMVKKVGNAKLSFADRDEARRLCDDYFDEARRSKGASFANVRTLEKLFVDIAKRLQSRCARTRISSAEIISADFPNGRVTATSAPAPADGRNADAPRVSAPAAAPQSSAFEFTLPPAGHPRMVSSVDHFATAVGLIDGRTGQGSGFFISIEEGLVLTAAHVVEANSEMLFLLDRGMRQLGLRPMWLDRELDLAILKVDSVPDNARFFAIDTQIDRRPALLERIIHCGFVKGTAVSDNFSTYEGVVSNYDPAKNLGERRFDAILSNIEATHGCSGGPVMRASDFTVIGTLQGGFEQAPARVITDVHHLFNHRSLIIKQQ